MVRTLQKLVSEIISLLITQHRTDQITAKEGQQSVMNRGTDSDDGYTSKLKRTDDDPRKRK